MSSSKQQDLRALNQLIESTQALLTQFSSSSAAKSPKIADAPNPLHVARDAAKLLKAHTTKISLLAINKPFTPTAITKVLRELSGTCVPALMSAVQICYQEKAIYPKFMAMELDSRIGRALREIGTLLEEIQAIGAGKTTTGNRDSLSCTGVVWAACDSLVELDQLGLAGLAVQKAEQYRETLKDAIVELQEWREGSDLDAEGQGDGLLDSDDEGVSGDHDSIDDIFNAANSMPADRPALRELVESAEARLKKVVLLYTALVKRRLKVFKSPSANSSLGEEEAKASVVRLGELLGHLQMIPLLTDDIALFLYDLDEDQAKEVLEKCIETARTASKVALLDWSQKEDEFSAWSKKWNEAIGS